LLVPVESVTQRLALDVGHDVVEEPVGLTRVVQRQDVRVLQVGRGLDLGQETVGADDRGQFGPEHFEGDLAVVLHVVGQVDRGHAALTEFGFDDVAVG